MDRLWSPWRYSYISASPTERECIFCEKASSDNDAENFVVFRGERNFVLLNLFPYTGGHLMIAPYVHAASLADLEEATLAELMYLTRDAERHLRRIYNAPGLNAGMNIGSAAGAGIAGHIHMHALPRWPGDVNFMTAIGETRVLPEDLRTTWEKLTKAFKPGTP